VKLIGLEEHWWSDELSTALRSVTGEAHDDSIDLFVTPEIERKLQDLDEGRLAAMQNSGIDMQVLSVSTPATQGLTPTDAVPMARDLNEQAAAAAARRPDSFAAFATLPMPDPAAAAGELERAVCTLGMVGAMIHGRTGDRMLDDPAFDDVFAMAERLQVPSTFTLKFRPAQYVAPTTADLTRSPPTGWPPEPGDGTWKPDSPRCA
jgi:predicted TIM-barrel fold metal-dependent hydrolase